jgi:hypothetical protein
MNHRRSTEQKGKLLLGYQCTLCSFKVSLLMLKGASTRGKRKVWVLLAHNPLDMSHEAFGLC